MAEALGTVASAIAVIDLAGKAVTLSFKLKSLWENAKDVPLTLLEKAEELQDIDEFLRDAESHAAKHQLPNSAWNGKIMQKALYRARVAMEDFQKTLDGCIARLTDKRRHRRKLAAAKIVLQKDSLEAMEQKLDRALRLFKMAQNLYCMACTSIIVQRLHQPLGELDTESTESADDLLEFVRLRKSRHYTSCRPDLVAISKGATLLGRLRFTLGCQVSHISIRTPDWLGNTVFFVTAQHSISGWQWSLSSHTVIDEFPDVIGEAIKNDNVVELQRRLHQANWTPYLYDQYGDSLLELAVDFDSVETSKWLLGVGLYPGSFGEWREPFNHKGARTFVTRTPLERLFNKPIRDFKRFVQILRAFVVYTPDDAEVLDDIWNLVARKKTFEQYREIQRVTNLELLSAPFSSRIWSCLGAFLETHWTWREILQFFPEIMSLNPESITSFWVMSGDWFAFSHLIAFGVGWELLESKGEIPQPLKKDSYCLIISSIARLIPEDLSRVSDGSEGETPLAKMLRIILTKFESSSPRIFDGVLQAAIRSWASILYANGVNLLNYGYKETTCSFVHREGRIPRWSRGEVDRCCYFRVLGIAYGQLPEQWKVWWSVYDQEYSGDFWHMVEGPDFKVPGSWEDAFDSDEEEQEEEAPWDDEERGNWIVWSEYRKLRPPI